MTEVVTQHSFAGVVRPPLIEELVLAKLRFAIVTAQLKPGEPLAEEEFAKRFGVSRTPVRQALRALASENLVTFVPRRGAVVAALSVDELKELFLLRSLLESQAARIGAERSNSQWTTAIRMLVSEMEAATQDPPTWLEADRKFHMTIYQASGLPRLTAIIGTLRDDAERYIRTYINLPDNIQTSNVKHQLILEAFAAANGKRCEQYTLDHLHEVEASFERALQSAED
jgi:DNA-binding GntR family transcriptional regulator